MSIQYNTQSQNISSKNMGDPIIQLPVDQTAPSSNEVQIIDTLFKKHRGTMDILVEESRESMIVVILIILFSLPQINQIIKKFVPINSEYIVLLVKGLTAGVLFWLLNHFYLSKKS